jgi:hypothetical protein
MLNSEGAGLVLRAARFESNEVEFSAVMGHTFPSHAGLQRCKAFATPEWSEDRARLPLHEGESGSPQPLHGTITLWIFLDLLGPRESEVTAA